MRKCVASFGSVSIDDNEAYRWATLTFVGGMLIIAILDRVGGWWLAGWVLRDGSQADFPGRLRGHVGQPWWMLSVPCALFHACWQWRGGQGADTPCAAQCPLPCNIACTSLQLCLLHSALHCAAVLLLQMVHLLVDWSDRRSRRKAAGCAGGASSANLLSHEDHRNCRRSSRRTKATSASASASAVAAPAVAVMEKQRSGGEAGFDEAAAGSLDVEAGGSTAQGGAVDGGGGGSSCSDDGTGSVSTQMAELSSPRRLTEPLDALTGAVVAATSPEVVHGERKASPAEVSAQLPACLPSFR
jgi:hypothetical protein